MRPRLYGGVRMVDGPSLPNIRKLDAGAMPWAETGMYYGLQVDLDHFAKLAKELDREMEQITEDVRKMVGFYVNLDSPQQVSYLLFKHLGLKQARAKLTKKGDRESADSEVLENIKHDHIVIPKILDFKQCSKLNGTYVKPMPLLARRSSFGVWRMYPDLTATRVPSGRFACREPNLLAIPAHSKRGKKVRQGFITQPGWKIVTVDECFHPDTLISTLLGSRKISDLVPGDKILTKRGDYIKYGEVSKSSRIEHKPAYRLTFDNGESVISSATHKWPTQVKGWATYGREEIKTTEELQVGDSMVPCKTGYTCHTDKFSDRYLTWYSSRGPIYHTTQHTLIAEAYYGPRPKDTHVHHIDENRTNNHPDNLEYKNRFKHASDHSKEHYPKQDHALRIERLRIGIKNRRSFVGTANPNSKITPEDMDWIMRLHSKGVPATEIAPIFGVSYGHIRQLIRGTKKINNHKLVSKEYVGLQPMWAITVEPDHNYVLACGVVTFNSQIEMRMAAHRCDCKELIRIYENDEDVYSDFAITAFKLPSDRYLDALQGKWVYPAVHKDNHRFPAKTCVLASLYDVTAQGLLVQMPVGKGWTENKCQDLLNAFALKYSEVLKTRKKDHDRARRHGFIWDMWGRILHTPGVRSVLPWVVSSSLRELGNFPYQSGAQGTIKLTMAAIHDIWEQSGLEEVIHPLLQVHDELLYECREDVADEWIEQVGAEFEKCAPLLVPIKWSGAKADNWGEVEK